MTHGRYTALALPGDGPLLSRTSARTFRHGGVFCKKQNQPPAPKRVFVFQRKNGYETREYHMSQWYIQCWQDDHCQSATAYHGWTIFTHREWSIPEPPSTRRYARLQRWRGHHADRWLACRVSRGQIRGLEGGTGGAALVDRHVLGNGCLVQNRQSSHCWRGFSWTADSQGGGGCTVSLAGLVDQRLLPSGSRRT